jgi:epoxyqueuosine reductase
MRRAASPRATLEEAVRARACELGFDLCRFARAEAPPQMGERLFAWLAGGAAGDMGWMAETAARRASPQALWPEAKSLILLALNYGPAEDPLAVLRRKSCGAISVYARHRDYHEVIKGRLKQLAGFLVAQGGGDVKVFVDTAPVMEKPLAQAAGIGWQGKHSNLVARDFGSWLFLGSVFTTLELAPDGPEVDHCGSCRACLDACPTDAFPAPYRLDARRCVSYLTIEHKGPIPRELRGAMGNRIYGCDDCLAVCPWNKYAKEAREASLIARDDLKTPGLADLVELDDAGFRALFSGGPVKRIGHQRFRRNVLIAIGNSGEAGFLPAVRRNVQDDSPLIRGAAVWALARLAPQEAAARAERAGEDEPDAGVRDEWAKETQSAKK